MASANDMYAVARARLLRGGLRQAGQDSALACRVGSVAASAEPDQHLLKLAQLGQALGNVCNVPVQHFVDLGRSRTTSCAWRPGAGDSQPSTCLATDSDG
jgi:hypothetical protein